MIKSGRVEWYRSEEITTAGRRFTPITPGKSATTTSPALNKLFLFRVLFCRIPKRVRRQLAQIFLAPRVVKLRGFRPRSQLLQNQRSKLQLLLPRQSLHTLLINLLNAHRPTPVGFCHFAFCIANLSLYIGIGIRPRTDLRFTFYVL